MILIISEQLKTSLQKQLSEGDFIHLGLLKESVTHEDIKNVSSLLDSFSDTNPQLRILFKLISSLILTQLTPEEKSNANNPT